MNSKNALIHSSSGRGHTRPMILSLLVGFVLGAAALLFALQNTEVVALTFLGYQFESSLALLVLVSVGVGILISILAFIPSAIARSLRIMGLKKENKRLADTVDAHAAALAAAPDPNVVVIDTRSTL